MFWNRQTGHVTLNGLIIGKADNLVSAHRMIKEYKE